MPVSPVPYCGAPPLPDSLWVRWNLDPALILVLVAVLWLALRQLSRENRWERASFTAGWAVAAAALVSPLCALSVSLFAARVGQHMILTLVAAPLIVLGFQRPWAGRMRRKFGVGSAAAVYTVFLWLWHMPGPYAATFQSTVVYWAMHLTLFGSAVWLWAGLLLRGAGGHD